MKKLLIVTGTTIVTLYAAGVIALRILSAPTHRAWTEDVLLDDGSTIVVRRDVRFEESDAWGSGAYNAVETEASIVFTGALALLPPWSKPLIALLLYRDSDTHEWVVVATTTSCERWNWWGEPRPPYWEYRLEPGGWREVPLSKASIGRSVNLLHRYQSDLGTHHITVADREKRESSPAIDKQFKAIQGTTDIGCTRGKFSEVAKRKPSLLRVPGTGMIVQ